MILADGTRYHTNIDPKLVISYSKRLQASDQIKNGRNTRILQVRLCDTVVVTSGPRLRGADSRILWISWNSAHICKVKLSFEHCCCHNWCVCRIFVSENYWVVAERFSSWGMSRAIYEQICFSRLARLVVDLSLHNCCSTPVDVLVEVVPRFVLFNIVLFLLFKSII